MKNRSLVQRSGTRAFTAGAAACVAGLLAASAAHAADGRVFERVSPADKVGGNALFNQDVGANAGFSSPDGDAFLWRASIGAEAPDAERGQPNPVRARRTATGWVQTTAVQGPVAGAATSAINANLVFGLLPSRDLSSVAFTHAFSFDATLPAETSRFSNGGLFRAGPDGRASIASRSSWAGATSWPDGQVGTNYTELVGGSADLRALYFTSRMALAPEDGAAGRQSDTSWSLYRNVDGAVSSAALLPDGTVDPDGAVAAGFPAYSGNGHAGADVAWAHSVSEDGRSALFVSPDPSSPAAQTRRPQLYRTVDGAPAARLSAPSGEAPVAGTSGVLPVTTSAGAYETTATFAVATPDHRFVFFATDDVLTDDVDAADASARKTYRYDTTTGATTYLEPLTIPEANIESPGANGPGVVQAVADDGTSVLYVKNGTLRLWRLGRPPVDVSTVDGIDSGLLTRADFLPGGDAVAIDAQQPLDGPQVSNGTGSLFPDQAFQNTYRYDVSAGVLRCLTCGDAEHPTPGARSSYTNQFATSRGDSNGARSGRGPNAFTSDGRSMFITSSSQLTPDDRNAVSDVYELRDGRFRLISTGAADAAPSYYMDNSLDGRDVFIGTRTALVPEDDDGLAEVYDARVGGGFPAAPVEVECSGDACQPQGPGHGVSPTPTSTASGPVASGPRDRPAAPAPTLRVIRVRGTAKAITVSLRLSAGGQVRLTGKGLRSTKRTAKSAGTYTLKPRLTAAARRTLRRRGRLVVSARVRYTPVTGAPRSSAVKFTIKRAAR